jgi:SAM-dependent methyltransferase
MVGERPIKKRKADDDSFSPPEYGSQEYWDERYKRKQNDDDENEADPFHVWYFSYQDLRPLLLPLIVGTSMAEEMLESASASETDQRNQGCELGAKDEAKINDCGEDLANYERTEGMPRENDTNSKTDSHKKVGARPNEVTGNENDEDDDDDSEEEIMRPGLACSGPISVLEVGCGDVPLGTDLCELRQTGKEILNKIVCCDYSPAVIKTLKDNARIEANKEQGDHPKSCNDSIVEFVVADARELDYSDGSFDLVLEKGTLDAMLSDKEMGTANCIRIVTECARVLTTGGTLAVLCVQPRDRIFSMIDTPLLFARLSRDCVAFERKYKRGT